MNSQIKNLSAKKSNFPQVLLGISLMACIFLSSCGSPSSQALPTLSVETIQTQTVGTFAADLTHTAFAMPTETATPTDTITPTPSTTP